MLHSIVRNHALVDGNNRLGLATDIAFSGVNDRWLTMTDHKAYDLVLAVAAGNVEDVTQIAQLLAAGSEST